MSEENNAILVRHVLERANDISALQTLLSQIDIDTANTVIKDAMDNETLTPMGRQNLMRMRTNVAGTRLKNLKQETSDGIETPGDNNDFIAEEDMVPSTQITPEKTEEIKAKILREQAEKDKQADIPTDGEPKQEKRFTVRQDAETAGTPQETTLLRVTEPVNVNGIDLPQGHIIKVPQKSAQALVQSGCYEFAENNDDKGDTENIANAKNNQDRGSE